MEGVSVRVAGAVTPLRVAASHPPVGPPYTIVPVARPLRVPVPAFVTFTDCAAGLAPPAVAVNVPAAADKPIAGAEAEGWVVPGVVPAVEPLLLLPPQAATPNPTSNTEMRRMQPRTVAEYNPRATLVQAEYSALTFNSVTLNMIQCPTPAT